MGTALAAFIIKVFPYIVGLEITKGVVDVGVTYAKTRILKQVVVVKPRG